MTDIKGQPRVPLIQRREGRPSAHPMCLYVPQPDTLRFLQQEPLPKSEAVSRGMDLSQKKRRNPQNRMNLEIQEIKGFMELGFDFSQDRLSPRVLDLLPGLKCPVTDHGNSNKNMEFKEWALESCELPNPNAAGVDMKEHLKLWARSVASTLKC